MSAAAMTVDGGLSVVFLLCFMTFSVKKPDGVRMQGISARIFITRLYGKLWEHVA